MRYLGFLKPIDGKTELKMDQADDSVIYQVNTVQRPVSYVIAQMQSVDGSAWSVGCTIKFKISLDGKSWFDPFVTQSYTGFDLGTNISNNVLGIVWIKFYVYAAGATTVYARPIVSAYMTEV